MFRCYGYTINYFVLTEVTLVGTN